MSDTIKFLKTREVKSPTRANQFDAGIDFYVPEFTLSFIEILGNKNDWMKDLKIMNLLEDKFFILPPHQKVLIPSGIHCQMIKNNRALIAANKSGIASKLGLVFGAQIVDFEYQGEIHLNLINTSEKEVIISAGMKISQFIETPVFNSDIIIEENKTPKEFYEKETPRGTKGFGASDDKEPKIDLNKVIHIDPIIIREDREKPFNKKMKNLEHTPKQDLTFQILDAHIDADKYSIKIISSKKWYVRLWYLISNPFYYLFKRYIRY